MSAHALPAVLVAAIVLAGTPSSGADPRQTSRSILHAEGCQTDLPAPSAAEGRPGGGVPVVLAPLEIPAPASPVFGLVLIAIALAFLIALLAPRLLPRGPAAPASPPAAPSAPGARSVADPEALAMEARFAEAIHALLLRALSELSRLPNSVAASPAATSREIMRHRSVPAQVQAALDPIVRAVERFHFGGEPAAAGDYASCASQYGRFRDAWRAAR